MPQSRTITPNFPSINMFLFHREPYFLDSSEDKNRIQINNKNNNRDDGEAKTILRMRSLDETVRDDDTHSSSIHHQEALEHVFECLHPFATYNWNNDDEIWFAQSAPFSGPSSTIGTGIFGKKKLRLISMDDGYEPPNTVRNINNFLNGNKTIFGFIGVVGSPTILAAYDLVVSSGLPLIGSYTGATFLRQPFHANFVNIRPSYYDETAAIMDVLIGKNMARKISVLHQDDPFGINGYEGVKRILDHMGIPMCSSGSYQRNTLNVEDAFYKIAKCDPDAIVVVALYAPATKFIKMVTNSTLYRKDILFAATSIASDLIVKELGPEIAPRVLFSQVAPSPTDTSSTLVKSFITARKSIDSNFTQGTFIEIEGYIAGKMTYHLLHRIIGYMSPSNMLTNLYYSQEVMFDNLKLGPFSSVSVKDPVYLIQTNFSTQFDCNQGSKSVWRTKADSNLNFYNYAPPFSWYTSGTCISTPGDVINPILLAQLVYNNLGSSNTYLTNGIKAALSTAYVQGRPIHLLTRTYSDFQSLISTTQDLVENYYITALVGSSGLGEVISLNTSSIDLFREIFKTSFPHIPLIGSVVDNPSIMSTTGSLFIPSMVNIRSTIIEEIGTLLQHAFKRGVTRISIVNCPAYVHINKIFKLLMSKLQLTIESEHGCSDTILFDSISINPQVVLVACASAILPGTLLKLDASSNLRQDALFFVLEEKKKLVLSSLESGPKGVQRPILYSSSFPDPKISAVTIVSRFKSTTPPLTDLSGYYSSDLALEGYFIGEFVGSILGSVADSAPSITGQAIIDFIYKSQQIVVRDQKYGYFIRDKKNSLCNIGSRTRFLFQIRNCSTSILSTTGFQQQSCCLQSVLEDSSTLNFRRPMQFVRFKPGDTEQLTIEAIDDFAKGVISFINDINTMGKYSFAFQFLTQTFNGSSDIQMLANDLTSKQQIFGVIAPDVDYDIEMFTNISLPIIGPKTANMQYRNYKKNVINIYPSLIDEIFNLVEFFLKFSDAITIVYESLDVNNYAQPQVLKTIQNIITNRQLSRVSLTCMTCVSDQAGSVIIMAETEEIIQFIRANQKIMNRVGLISEAYEEHDDLKELLSLHSNVYMSTIVSLTTEMTGFVESEFTKHFQVSFPNDVPTIESIDGFVSFLFVEKVFESFLDRIQPRQQQAFIDKIYSLSVLDIGDITLGKFTNTCNQGTRRLYVSRFSLSNTSEVITVTEPNSLFTISTCGYNFPSPAVMDYLYYILISILAIIFLIVAMGISGLLIYRQYKAKKSHLHAPKGGVISFAFTDIQNSTVLWQYNEKAMKLALAIHNKIVRDNIKKYRGYEVKTQGDSFFVAFRKIEDCINWAFSVQSDLLKANWPSDIITQYDCRPEFEEGTKVLIYSGLRVRMGLHCGQAEYIFDKTVKRPDYFGNTINQTARIQALARGGEILCSEAMLQESKYLFKISGPSFEEELSHQSLNIPRRSSESTLSKKRRSVVPGSNPIYTAEDFGYCSLKGIKEEVRVFTLKNNDMKLRVFPPIGRYKNIEETSNNTLRSIASVPTFETSSINGDDIIVHIPDQASDNQKSKPERLNTQAIELPEIMISGVDNK
ncbi:predicted protein [Naegleria gruberi]|uniref:Predicted protein n=1 Tax=Naegleria gruberi TaxID=5762 RepID=D2VSL7_NAEGR|nr:uncharacterized protein NAEGRDRAFT_51940 [Naegleria gruberi]EFC40146.1 predicted protein [Naegleria gruberi]|eukprot:XP_002672890.1 predicted protein [Naegleria gruberi strain NEG-M]